MSLSEFIKVPLEHHAYFIEGVRTEVLPSLVAFIENTLGISIRANPDVWIGEFQTFGIDDARKLSESSTRKPFGSSTSSPQASAQGKSSSESLKLFVLSFDTATREAQNALLKVFEEPTEGTHFFVVANSAEVILPTLRSRINSVGRLGSEKETGEKGALNFLKSTQSKRLELVRGLIESKDTAESLRFLDNIERLVRRKTKPQDMSKEDIFALSELSKCRGYLRGRSSSFKLILEHLALVFPVMK